MLPISAEIGIWSSSKSKSENSKYKDTSRKMITLVKEGSEWKILDEKTIQ